MSQSPVISVERVSKAYRMWTDPSRRLVSPLLAEAGRWLPGAAGRALDRRAAAGYRDFYALQDVSFEVRRGEAVGIIGRNGAGKSTLLQLIAGTLQASAGTVAVNGRVAALLELGAGFNQDFTGRENVYLSGAVLGLGRAEMEARFDSVAAFADIGDFIDQPVSTYSSGMQMRLAFAVNTCVDPDILIVDEALSVGDAPFQAKCFRRLRALIDKGVSLLFVSHDIGTVRSICTRALWLKQGRAEKWGEAKEVAKEYEKYCWSEQGVQIAGAPAAPVVEAEDAALAQATGVPPALMGQHEDFDRTAGRERWGTGDVRIQNIVLLNSERQQTTTVDYDSPVEAWFLLELMQPVASDCILGVRFSSIQGSAVLAVQDLKKTLHLNGQPGDRFAARISLRLPLHHTNYTMRTAVFGYKDGILKPGPAYDFGDAIIWDVIEHCLVVTVRPFERFPLSGPVHLHGATEISRVLPKQK